MTEKQKKIMERRRKRRLQKRIRAVIVLILLILLIFFGVKAVVNFVSENSQESTSGENSSLEVETAQLPQESESGTDSESTEPQPAQEPTAAPVPQTEKPAQSWATILVNAANPMPEDYAVEVRTIQGTQKQFDVRGADSLEQMLNDAAAAGYKMYLVSTYRTVDYQKGLLNRKITEYKNAGYDETAAYNEAIKWVAIPGTSEHNLGLAADIVSSTWYNTNSDLTHQFEDTPHFQWLYEHCADYGFILRYLKGKEDITGIVYEPWHFRYVGVDAAKYIMSQGIVLEEFNQ